MGSAGGGAGAGGGRATRALRLLLLLVLALAAVEYLFGSILEASPLRTYLYTPIYNSTQPSLKFGERSASLGPKPTDDKENPVTKDSHAKNNTLNINKYNVTKNNTGTIITVEFETPRSNTTNMTVTERSKPSPAYNATSLFITKIMDSMKQMVTTERVVKKTEQPLPLCDKNPPNLGPIPVNKTELELTDIENKFPEVYWGGRYSPPNCTARDKVAIIVPYRDRQQHLAIFLNHMHPFLMKQQIEYGIFIVEQEGNKDFNRAKLMNVGFMEAQRLKAGGWQCFIFHDIDLLPMDSRNLYTCPRQPRHMSASIDKLNFKLPYDDIFGGVSALTLEQFTNVNGFSNSYWGWGGEDDDMFCRLKIRGYHVSRYKMSIARYAMLAHKQSVPNPKRYKLLSETSQTFQKVGLSSLEYQLEQVVQFHLYTHILVNIDERS